MITPDPPAGSEHYREGWRHGYEQAAIDRERSADVARLVPEAGQARADRLADGIRKFADDCKLLLDSGGLDNRVVRSIAQQERNLRALLAAAQAPESPTNSTPKAGRGGSGEAETTTDTVQAPDVADLAYARSEVDKWLADGDPYCILPTRTEHIPALLARLDELEGTR